MGGLGSILGLVQIGITKKNYSLCQKIAIPSLYFLSGVAISELLEKIKKYYSEDKDESDRKKNTTEITKELSLIPEESEEAEESEKSNPENQHKNEVTTIIEKENTTEMKEAFTAEIKTETDKKTEVIETNKNNKKETKEELIIKIEQEDYLVGKTTDSIYTDFIQYIELEYHDDLILLQEELNAIIKLKPQKKRLNPSANPDEKTPARIVNETYFALDDKITALEKKIKERAKADNILKKLNEKHNFTSKIKKYDNPEYPINKLFSYEFGDEFHCYRGTIGHNLSCYLGNIFLLKENEITK